MTKVMNLQYYHQSKVMGGSEHSQSEFARENDDMNANDQYKQGPETDIGTDNPKRPEVEGTDGGNVGTDIISPQEGASDDKSDEPLVSPSNPPPNGKILKRKKEKKKEKKKRKRKNQREIMTNYFLLQRTGLEICNLELPANLSAAMMFSPRTCATLFKMTLIR
jgi:hypothetical protein